MLYEESGREAERWWSEEQRGYTTNDRLRWILERAAVTPREGCEHVAAAADAVDNALLMLPPAMLPGAWQMLRTLRRHFTLAVISDTGFASGRAQDRLLEKDAARGFFSVDDLLHGRRPREAAPGDLPPRRRNARRPAARDPAHRRQRAHRRARRARRRLPRHPPRRRRNGGPSEAEFVARSYEELTEYLMKHGDSRGELRAPQ